MKDRERNRLRWKALKWRKKAEEHELTIRTLGWEIEHFKLCIRTLADLAAHQALKEEGHAAKKKYSDDLLLRAVGPALDYTHECPEAADEGRGAGAVQGSPGIAE